MFWKTIDQIVEIPASDVAKGQRAHGILEAGEM